MSLAVCADDSVPVEKYEDTAMGTELFSSVVLHGPQPLKSIWDFGIKQNAVRLQIVKCRGSGSPAYGSKS